MIICPYHNSLINNLSSKLFENTYLRLSECHIPEATLFRFSIFGLLCDFKRFTMIKFVSDLRQVGGFLWVLRFPPPIKLTATL